MPTIGLELRDRTTVVMPTQNLIDVSYAEIRIKLQEFIAGRKESGNYSFCEPASENSFRRLAWEFLQRNSFKSTNTCPNIAFDFPLTFIHRELQAMPSAQTLSE